jgi:hypothetical protein
MVRAVFDRQAALQELQTCPLGHQARTKRLVHTAGLLAEHAAGRSLPDRLPRRADYEGALNLMNHPAVTHAAVLQPHTQATRARMAACPGVVLNISDTTELDFTGLKVACLGPIGTGGGRGFLCHNSLAVDPQTGDLLGLTSQVLHLRDADAQVQAQRQARAARTGAAATLPGRHRKRGRRPDEPVAERRDRASRESRLWVQGCDALGEVPAGRLWVDVCDRSADTFEFLQSQADRRRHYVIRSKHSRGVADGEGALLARDGDGPPRLLHELLRALPGVLSWQVEVQANRGQVARRASVQLAWRRVWLQPPATHAGQHGDAALEVWAIRVWEPEPPPEVAEPLEWLLLTNVAVASTPQARERVAWYCWRPRVEEFHKAMKTGLGVEDLQLQSRGGLEPLIGLLSILAVALVNLRQQARSAEAARQPAREVVAPLWVRVLSTWLHQEERDLSLREFVLGLARLGGYLNRCRGAWPGWLVLWRGLTKLLHMVEYETARGKSPPRSPEL